MLPDRTLIENFIKWARFCFRTFCLVSWNCSCRLLEFQEQIFFSKIESSGVSHSTRSENIYLPSNLSTIFTFLAISLPVWMTLFLQKRLDKSIIYQLLILGCGLAVFRWVFCEIKFDLRHTFGYWPEVFYLIVLGMVLSFYFSTKVLVKASKKKKSLSRSDFGVFFVVISWSSKSEKLLFRQKTLTTLWDQFEGDPFVNKWLLVSSKSFLCLGCMGRTLFSDFVLFPGSGPNIASIASDVFLQCFFSN